MNCIHPTAPALETLRLVPNPVSILLMPASTCHGIPYCVPHAWYIGSRNGGISNWPTRKLGRPSGLVEGLAMLNVGLNLVGTPFGRSFGRDGIAFGCAGMPPVPLPLFRRVPALPPRRERPPGPAPPPPARGSPRSRLAARVRSGPAAARRPRRARGPRRAGRSRAGGPGGPGGAARPWARDGSTDGSRRVRLVFRRVLDGTGGVFPVAGYVSGRVL